MFQYFFILKQKWEHVSTLHVVHHTLMAFTWWWGVKFSPGGLGTFHAMINSLVHFVMYAYYGLSALGPEYRKYLWWKKYLTTFQMVSRVKITVIFIKTFLVSLETKIEVFYKHCSMAIQTVCNPFLSISFTRFKFILTRAVLLPRSS